MQDMRYSTSGESPVTPPTPPVTPEMPHEHHRAPLIWSLIVVAVVLAAGLWLLGQRADNMTTYDENGNAIVQSPEGQFAAGFPRELLLEEDATPEMSYTISYEGEGRELPVARYSSTLSYEENINEYRRLLVADGWTVLKDANSSEGDVTNFYATKDGAEVNITVAWEADGTVTIEIAYLSAPVAAPAATE